MTLIEWRAALRGFAERHGGRRASDALGQSELRLLMGQFPDGES